MPPPAGIPADNQLSESVRALSPHRFGIRLTSGTVRGGCTAGVTQLLHVLHNAAGTPSLTSTSDLATEPNPRSCVEGA